MLLVLIANQVFCESIASRIHQTFKKIVNPNDTSKLAPDKLYLHLEKVLQELVETKDQKAKCDNEANAEKDTEPTEPFVENYLPVCNAIMSIVQDNVKMIFNAYGTRDCMGFLYHRMENKDLRHMKESPSLNCRKVIEKTKIRICKNFEMIKKFLERDDLNIPKEIINHIDQAERLQTLQNSFIDRYITNPKLHFKKFTTFFNETKKCYGKLTKINGSIFIGTEENRDAIRDIDAVETYIHQVQQKNNRALRIKTQNLTLQ